MYKVLIADDEVKVCKLINNLIDWEQFGLKVVAMIHDGVTALQFIKDEKPDIVITDIRMPGYDGIELIKQAKEINPEINFIIVSGYRHFDYAHNAIKYGVEDYLLKPLKKTEFMNTLAKMVQKKEKAAQGISETADMKMRIHLDEKLVKQTLLDKLLADSSFLREDITKEELNTEYRCNFISGFYQRIIIKPDLPVENDDGQSYMLLMEKVKDITQKQLGEFCHELLITIAKKGIVCLINDSSGNLTGIRRQLKSIRNDIIRMRDVFLNVKVTIGIGEAVTEVKNIKDTLQGAEYAILNRLVQGTGNILTASSTRQESITAYDLIDPNFRTNFINYIETLNSEELTHLLNEIKQKIYSYKNIDGALIYEVCREVYEVFSYGMMKNYYAKKNLLDKEEFDRQFYLCGSVTEVFHRLNEDITSKIDQLCQDKKLADKKPIRMAKQYIKEKYQLPITLEEISSQIGFNSTYFSTLFKKETGQNFLEYLTDTRIQAAKQLLADTNRSVNQVSEEVGYIDIKHFTKVFKKSTGLTPSEYRKLYY
jgi:two-component system response regulator YesN